MKTFPDRNAMLDSLPKGGVCAEVGVHKGDFAAEILERIKPRVLFLVDPYRYQEHGYDDMANTCQGQHDEAKSIAQERFADFDNVLFEPNYSFAVADKLNKWTFQFAYIDANHGYANTLIDIAQWWLLVKSGGFLAGHDYVNATHPGVGKAVDDFCRIVGTELYATTEENDRIGPTSWMIQKP